MTSRASTTATTASHDGARADQQRHIHLSARDIAILRDLADQRLLTAELVAWRHFPPADGTPAWHPARSRVSPAAQRRLLQLYHAGYVDRLEQPVWPNTGGAPIAYRLSGFGAATLAAVDGRAAYVPAWASALSMDHTLFAARVWCALAVACTTTDNLEMCEWIGESEARRRDAARKQPAPAPDKRPIPDGTGTLVLDGRDRVRVFVEVDQGTETHAIVAQKLTTYARYRGSPDYRDTYGDDSWRILLVTVGSGRLETLVATVKGLERTLPALHGRVLCGLRASITPGAILEPLWIVPHSGRRRALVREGLRMRT